MKQTNRHGNELADHLHLKPEGKAMFLSAGADLVLCEHRNSDVVAFKRIGKRIYIICLEYERTGRNVLRNIRRNLQNGADIVLEVGMNCDATAAIARVIKDQLTPVEQNMVLSLGITELNIEFLKRVNRNVGVNLNDRAINLRLVLKNAPQAEAVCKGCGGGKA